MSQKTAKTVVEVLEWVETNDHHKGEWIGPSGAETHLVLSGHGHVLRIPTAIQEKTRHLIKPGGNFDTRMFRVNASGRVRLWRARKKAAA